MNMTLSDPGFKKDYSESRLILSCASNCLENPLKLCDMASEALRAVMMRGGEGLREELPKLTSDAEAGVPPAHGRAFLRESGGSAASRTVNTKAGSCDQRAVYSLSMKWLDCADGTGLAGQSTDVPAGQGAIPDKWPDEIGEEGRGLVKRILPQLDMTGALIKKAFRNLSERDMQLLAAGHLGELYEVEDDAVAHAALVEEGVSEKVIAEILDNGRDLDAAPHSKAFLDRLEAVDLAKLLEAGWAASQLVSTLKKSAAGISEWPAKPVAVETSYGTVVIGSKADDIYDMAATVIFDPAGNDRYGGEAGAANGLDGRAVAIIVDMGGDDEYMGSRLLGPASALFGVAALLDCGGADIYRNKRVGSGAGIFGTASLVDEGGDDVYESGLFCQGAGVCGLGLCHDGDGNDTYRAGGWAQGFGGVRGMGWLLDKSGNDLYFAGGQVPDYERHKEHYLSMSQGFAIGVRPSGGGGIGLLTDLAGNDTYRADVFGQGVSYWYSVGMLIDIEGHDTYSIYEYGQGSGIHLSSGFLYDGAGNDVYTGHSLSQGNAHDFAVGVMIDKDGNDLYTADHYSQGRAINNAFALLCDGAGNDSYFARKNAQCQGRGQHNRDRGYGSLSVLMDLSGKDGYTGGATNNARLLYPDYGIVYDFEEDE
jgi:hypothetical protein